MKRHMGETRLEVIHGDITECSVDAVVNAAIAKASL